MTPFGAEAAVERTLLGQPAAEMSPELTQQLFQRQVAQPLLRSFDEDIAPRLREGFARHGALFSTARGQAEGRALGQLQDTMAGQLSGMVHQGEQMRLGMADAAAGRAASLAPMFTGMSQMGQFLGLQQAQMAPFQTALGAAMGLAQPTGQAVDATPQLHPFAQIGANMMLGGAEDARSILGFAMGGGFG